MHDRWQDMALSAVQYVFTDSMQTSQLWFPSVQLLTFSKWLTEAFLLPEDVTYLLH